MEKNNQNTSQIQIELPDDIAQGTYANLAIITHSSSEFIIDYIRMLPGLPKAKVQSRIILTPEHAKRLLMALADNVKQYEDLYGIIRLEAPSSNHTDYPTAGEA